MLKLSNSGDPFKTELAAKQQLSRSRKAGKLGGVVVAVDGGYAVELPDVIAESAEVPTTESQATATVSETPIKKHRVTTPWKPSSFLGIPEHLKVPGRRYRWGKKDRPGNMEKKLAEGWVIDIDLTKEMKKLSPPTIQDGKSMDSTMQVREMIVMWMPEETAIARNKYYSDKAGAAQRGAQKAYKESIRDVFGNNDIAYGDIETT